MEEALRAGLLAHAALAALVGERVHWNVRPQGRGLPAVVLHRISGGREYHMQGRSELSGALVQADCWATSYAGALALKRALIDALDALEAPFQGAFVESERDTFEAVAGPEPGGGTVLHRASADIRVWSTAA